VLAEYVHHLWAASGSGEYALGALFAPVCHFVIPSTSVDAGSSCKLGTVAAYQTLVIDVAAHTFTCCCCRAQFGWAKQPLMHRLRTMQVPTYFLYGKYDWMDPAPVERLRRSGQNPNIRQLIVLDDCGHQLFLENPTLFNHVVGQLCAKSGFHDHSRGVVDEANA